MAARMAWSRRLPHLASGFPAEKTVLVQNFPTPGDRVESATIRSPIGERRPVVVYAGGIANIRGIKEMVQAMSLIPDTTEATLVLAGRFDPPHLEQEVKQLPGWNGLIS